MSVERAIKNCVNCYQFAEILLTGAGEESDIKGSPVIIQLYNNAMAAVEESGVKNKEAILRKCVDCNMKTPNIANELRKLQSGK
jgi:hypothetical protein